MVKRLINPLAGRPTPIGSLLTAAGHRLSSELDAALRAEGFDDLRASHAPVFMVIDPAGSTVTELAEGTKMTKQAVGELIRYLTGRGYLETSTDPEDRRIRRVRLTRRGWQAIRTGERVINEFDSWLEESIGANGVHQLRDALVRIIQSGPRAKP